MIPIILPNPPFVGSKKELIGQFPVNVNAPFPLCYRERLRFPCTAVAPVNVNAHGKLPRNLKT